MSKARDIADLDFNSPDIDGGNIDGATIGGTTPAAGSFTGLNVNYSTQATANLAYGLIVNGNDSGSNGDSGSIFIGGINNTVRGAFIAAEIQSSANNHDLIFGVSGPSASPTERLRIASTGAATFSSTVTASSYFLGSGNEISLATASAGNIFLRPNGQSTSGQMQLASSGAATFNSTVTSTGLAVTQSGSVSSPPFSVSSNLNSGQSIAEFRSTGNSNSTIDLRADGTGDPKILFDLNGASAFSLGVDNSDSDKFKISGGHLLGTNDRFVIDSAGNVRFNPGVIDSDFTVSSDGYSHMLHVDGANNQVNVGTASSMNGKFNVRTSSNTATIMQLDTGLDNGVASSPIALELRNAGGTLTDGLYIYDAKIGGSTRSSVLIRRTGGNTHQYDLQQRDAGGTMRDRMTITNTEVVFNEPSLDMDFRVASNSDTHMLFVDGGNDDVMMGNNTPVPASGHNNQAGFGYSSEGTVEIANTNNASTLQLGKNQGTDGDFITMRKQSNPVGHLAVSSGAYLAVRSHGGNLRLGANNTDYWSMDEYRIYPVNDAVDDLGLASNRVKDLYLSGGVYLGGTATANKLDDYEEGTWTPALGAYTGTNPTVSGSSSGFYTKIGQLVTVSFNLDSISVSGTTSGIMKISGLPFTPNGDAGGSYTGHQITLQRPDTSCVMVIADGFGILSQNNGGNWAWEQNSIFDGTSALRVTATYKTNS